MRRRFLAMMAGSLALAILAPAVRALAAGPAGGDGGAGAIKPAATRTKDKLKLVAFRHSPFPYDGPVPEQDLPFLDVSDGQRRGHTSPRGGVYWEEPTYSDRRSLLFIPAGFDAKRRGHLVAYFHGNNAMLERDVQRRQEIPRQLAASGLNAVLVAPQFAVDALDSSAGHFWQAGGFARYLDEACAKLAALHGRGAKPAAFSRLPVVLVAYSGGYHPAAFALSVGGAGKRIAGVLLFDALYGDVEKFASWFIAHRAAAFLMSAHSTSSRAGNLELITKLAEAGIRAKTAAPRILKPGTVAIFDAGAGLSHGDFMQRAWVDDPLAWALARIGRVKA